MSQNLKIILTHYGTQEAWASAWGVTPSAVSQWVSEGDAPVRRLIDIESLSNGALVSRIVDGVVIVQAKEA